MGSTLVFDLETIPDAAAGRRCWGFPDHLSDLEVRQGMLAKQRAQSGDEFLRHPFHQVVCISCALSTPQELRVWSIGDTDSTELDIIQRFFQGIRKYKPTLVSWNGTGFDLPVLHYRALFHGISAPEYWERGESDPQFKWDNYLGRYHYRHRDLMDILSGYQARASAKLDEIATLCGFPGKMDMNGAGVLAAYEAGEIQSIRDYCETDVLNTYLIYLRFEKMRGKLSEAGYLSTYEKLVQYLTMEDKPHFKEFREKCHNPVSL